MNVAKNEKLKKVYPYKLLNRNYSTVRVGADNVTICLVPTVTSQGKDMPLPGR